MVLVQTTMRTDEGDVAVVVMPPREGFDLPPRLQDSGDRAFALQHIGELLADILSCSDSLSKAFKAWSTRTDDRPPTAPLLAKFFV